MNRLEYLTELRQRLVEGGLPKEEQDDALRFYEEIFLDAGVAYEEQTAENLGSPEELARKILLDSNIHADGDPVFKMDEAIDPEQARAQYQASQNATENGVSSAIKILIIVLTSPIWFPFVCAFGGIAFALIVSIIAIIFAFVLAGVGLIVGGVSTLFSVPPVGLMMIGTGMIFVSLCSLVLTPLFKRLWRAMVSLYNSLCNLVRRIFNVGRVTDNG